MDELVNRLRLAQAVLSKNKDLIALLSDASDVIEELQSDNAALNGTVSNLIQQIEELRKQHEAQQENIVVLMDIIENDRNEIEWLKKCVNDLPKPARSKWINVEVSYVGDMKHNVVENVASMQCQNCKRYHNEVYFFGQVIEHVNYCPNCGARMEVDTNDS